jgi:DNA end-binding protein Ku
VESNRVNATLTFGMVSIPVGVVPVLRSTDRVSFSNLHAHTPAGEPCLTPLKSPKLCPTCDVQVEQDDVVSGYKVAKDSFLVISEEEKASVAPNRSPMIEISKFVTGRSVALMNAVRLGQDKSYWLPPQNDLALHPYAVLAHGMREEGVLGLAKATIWQRQWPVCIEVIDGMLALTQLHPASGVREGGMELPPVKANERSLARTVISEYTGEFEMDDLVSDADDALKGLIEAKLMGLEFTAPEIVVPEPTLNIMDALKASMKKAKTTKRKKVSA